MSDSTDVVKYDRDMLDHKEVQPIATEDGHVITVNRYGKFCALIGDVEISERTLEVAREKVHRTHLAQQVRKKKKTLAVPMFIYVKGDYNNPAWADDAFFRGVHAGTGALQWSKPDGSKGFCDDVWLFPRGCEIASRVKGYVERITIAQAKLDAVRDLLQPILKSQFAIMYGHRVGYSQRPRLRNNAEQANTMADEIVANVLVDATEDES